MNIAFYKIIDLHEPSNQNILLQKQKEKKIVNEISCCGIVSKINC